VGKLKNLYLCFKGCQAVGDVGLEVLASRLPKELVVLKLDLGGCEGISNQGVEAIADSVAVMKCLNAFHASFQDCGHVGESAAARLVQRLPASLHGAKVNLIGTAVSPHIAKTCRRLVSMREWMPMPVEKKKAFATSSI
ncbi:unnamed protein product, partial [Polarella glacialis]